MRGVDVGGGAARSRGAEVLARLRARLEREGLRIALPLDGTRFAAVLGSVGRGAADDLATFCRGAVVIGDGGGDFFARFIAQGRRSAAASDPLDDYTRGIVERGVADAMGDGGVGVPHRVLYPFAGDGARLPFQRLGEAAGLPPAGPLGLQVHPTFGPWWAYRALVLVAIDLETEPPLAETCPRCEAPCVTACPGEAVTREQFLVAACVAHRLAAVECHASCRARISCPVGEAWRYPAPQLGFHMRASLIKIRERAARAT